MKSSLLTRIKKLEAENKVFIESEQIKKERALYESSLYEFTKAAWPAVEGGREFKDGLHIKAICDHLEEVAHGRVRHLLINVPPAVGKSTIISIMFPAWVWTTCPNKQFLYVSYAKSLSQRHSVYCRNLIKSDWYQKYWSNHFHILDDSDTQSRFDNNKFGYRMVSSISGTATGFHADILITDDANDARSSESQVVRDNTNEWYSHVWPSRVNDQKTGCFVDVQQRLHENDLSGFILNKKVPGLVFLRLPMEFELGHRCVTVPLKDTKGLPWKDWRKKEGELLWPQGIGAEELKKLKARLGTYATAGQLQQRPAPIAGGLIKAEWFNIWQEEEPPECIYTIQSWDIAVSDKETACFSACTTWGVFVDPQGNNNIVLLSLYKARADYPTVRKMAKRLANNYLDTDEEDPYPENYKNPPDVVIIEDTGISKPLIADLQQADIHITKFNPKRWGDKENRVIIITHIIESGRVWLPGIPPEYDRLRKYASTFLRDCVLFPNSTTRDVVDSMSQALIYMKNQGVVYNPGDPREEQYVSYNDQPLY